ncbi:MAG: hypothetical protein KTR31_12650 [Myxococcales bacterium]|nr:hypothetical protein [Myxococcales bacterium]
MTRLPLALGILGTLFACRGNDGPAGAEGADGATAIVDVSTEAAGANCATGGSRVDYGVDSSGNGILDASEIDGTFYVCNGASGEPAPEVLVESEMVFEDAYGCDQGYEMVWIGTDASADGALQQAEIETTITTCLAPDYDADAVLNLVDNCPLDANDDQFDDDLDSEGDACDADTKTLYGFTRGDDKVPSFLYTFELSTGVATLVGDIGYAINALRVNPADGALYGMSRIDSAGDCDVCLLRIDPSDASATVVTEVRLDSGPYSHYYKKYKKYYPKKWKKYYGKKKKVQPYAMASMAFLSDGSLFAWTEGGDKLVSVDTSNGLASQVGTPMGSSRHSLSATADDQLLFLNGSSTYLIDPADGSRTFLGSLPVSMSRGDLNPDTLLHVGVVSQSTNPTQLDLTQLSTTDAPVGLGSFPITEAPKGPFHGFTFDR